MQHTSAISGWSGALRTGQSAEMNLLRARMMCSLYEPPEFAAAQSVAKKGMSAVYAQVRSKPRNRLLAALPPEDFHSLEPHLEPVSLASGEVLVETGEGLARVYFVEAGVVGVVALFESGASALMATVGREGMVGIGAALGSAIAGGRHYVVRVPGCALALEASRFRAVLRESPELRATCQAYAQAFLGQVLQTIACNKVHAVERRCARWLLVSHDRSDGHELAMSQQFLAQMLGVSLSQTAAVTRTLRKAGLIRYRRGGVTLLDRPGLETAACECYRIDRERYQRLLPTASN